MNKNLTALAQDEEKEQQTQQKKDSEKTANILEEKHDRTNVWELPTSIFSEKKKVLILEDIHQELFSSRFNCVNKLNENEKKQNENEKENEKEKEKEKNIAEEMSFKKIKRSDMYPSVSTPFIDFYVYLNYLSMLLFTELNEREQLQIKNIFPKEKTVIKIKKGNATIEDYLEIIKTNLSKRKMEIMDIFKKIQTFLKNDHDKKYETKNIYTYQIKYILSFIKSIDERLYIDIMKIMKMEMGNLFSLKEDMKENNISDAMSVVNNTTYFKEKGFEMFELKDEDNEFINSKIKQIQNHTHKLFSVSTYRNYRFQCKSVLDTIHHFLIYTKTKYFNELKNKEQINNCIHKIESFYKLNDFLTLDILFLLKKENSDCFHFLLFYPFELKQTKISLKEEGNTELYYFDNFIDENFLLILEIIYIYNILRQKIKTDFSFSIVDTAPYIHFKKEFDGCHYKQHEIGYEYKKKWGKDEVINGEVKTLETSFLFNQTNEIIRNVLASY